MTGHVRACNSVHSMSRPEPPLLEARGLGFGYVTSSPLINGWHASFPAGTMTALTGPSGRGKSTLLYLLGLMLQPAAGTVLVEGSDASQMSDAQRARLRAKSFGFVFQDAALDATRTVLDNVTETAMYRGESRRAVEAHAHALLKRFEVDVPPNRKPGQVSGGQAQRIALCRALLNNPRIVLADEPTGNLDPTTAAMVVGGLREQASQGSAVIVVTHSPEIARVCDREIQL